jgi:hypothetical protein
MSVLKKHILETFYTKVENVMKSRKQNNFNLSQLSFSTNNHRNIYLIGSDRFDLVIASFKYLRHNSQSCLSAFPEKIIFGI